MDRNTIMDNYVEAVRQAVLSEKRVTEQRRIVDLLTQYGRDTKAARDELMALEKLYALNIAQKDKLRLLLEE